MFVYTIPCIYVLLLLYALHDWRALFAWFLLWGSADIARRMSFSTTAGLVHRRARKKMLDAGIELSSSEGQKILEDEVWRPEPRRSINILLRGAFTGILLFQGWSIPSTFLSRIVVMFIVFVLHAFNFSDAFRSWFGTIILLDNPEANLQRWTFLNIYGGFKQRLLLTPIGIFLGALISPFFSFINLIIER